MAVREQGQSDTTHLCSKWFGEDASDSSYLKAGTSGFVRQGLVQDIHFLSQQPSGMFLNHSKKNLWSEIIAFPLIDILDSILI